MNNYIIIGITIAIGISIFVWIILSARKLSKGGMK